MEKQAELTEPKSRKSVFFLRCPSCGKGKLFKSKHPYELSKVLDMNEHCAYCKEDFEVETGFYQGAMYISYIITCAMCIAILPIYIAFNFSREKFLDNAMYYLIACFTLLFVMAPYIVQLSRAVWLKIHVLYLKNSKEDS